MDLDELLKRHKLDGGLRDLHDRLLNRRDVMRAAVAIDTMGGIFLELANNRPHLAWLTTQQVPDEHERETLIIKVRIELKSMGQRLDVLGWSPPPPKAADALHGINTRLLDTGVDVDQLSEALRKGSDRCKEIVRRIYESSSKPRLISALLIDLHRSAPFALATYLGLQQAFPTGPAGQITQLAASLLGGELYLGLGRVLEHNINKDMEHGFRPFDELRGPFDL
jgi:hypothetical protein